MCYSLEFRKEVLKTRKNKKLSYQKTAELFGIGRASIVRWAKRIESCKTRNKPATKIDMEALAKDVELYPDAFQKERAIRLNVSNSCIQFALRRLGVTYKKNSKTSESRRREAKKVSRENG